MKKMKKHYLTGRKRTPESIAKYQATMKAKRVGKEAVVSDPANVKDTLIFLKKARNEIARRARAGEDVMSNDVYIYVLNAARCAEGGLK